MSGSIWKKMKSNRLKIKYGVYITKSGRICLPGLNKDSFAYVVDSLKRIKDE